MILVQQKGEGSFRRPSKIKVDFFFSPIKENGASRLDFGGHEVGLLSG